MSDKKPHLFFERKLWKEGYLVVGVDEVGRGAFAGPIHLGGVVFHNYASQDYYELIEKIGINDSKKLTPKKREELSKIIKKKSLFYATVPISVSTINKVGIGKATEIGVRRLIKYLIRKQKKNTRYKMPNTKYFLLMDAFYIKYVKGLGLKNQKPIIHGDEISLSIAAASIIAKVKRDEYMRKLSKQFPSYDWFQNKGYGTKKHINAIKIFGVSIHHRSLYIRKIRSNNSII